MLFALAWQAHLVILAYVFVLVGMGWHFARKQQSGEEYFLAGRSLPWLAIGLSIMATLMSSLTYIAEPGEVWQSSVTSLLGKFIAVVTETVVVVIFFIPLLMRFRFVSAYEYLGYRFGPKTRKLAVCLFVTLVVLWMGFVVLAMARTISGVTDLPVDGLIVGTAMIGTIYTIFGGMRAVIWKDVLQVVLMFGGCLVCLAYVSWASGGSWLPDWLHEAGEYRKSLQRGQSVVWSSFDPFERITVMTFALSMFFWHFCTHLGNQMVVQRYFSSHDLKAARRSFITAVLASVVVNSLLVFVGLAVLYYYRTGLGTLTLDPKVKSDADMIFPTFMVKELPAGLGGAVLVAVLSAAMSTIDAGVNAVATVLSAERNRPHGHTFDRTTSGEDQVRFAQKVTLAAGVLIMAAGFVLMELTKGRNILEMMPRTFNAFLVPIGTMFFLGMFVPRCGAWSAVLGGLTALIVALNLGYAKELYGIYREIDGVKREISFTLVIPGAFLAGVTVGVLTSFEKRPRPEQLAGLTWFTRHQRPLIDPRLFADWAIAESDSRHPTA